MVLQNPSATRSEVRARRAVGTGCRVLAVGALMAVVTVLTGSTVSVGVALVVAALVVTGIGGRRR